MQLLEHFKELTVHPKNAEELKGLILQLAVQGKLTRGWRESHPELVSGTHAASTLIQRIKAEKAQLIKDGKIRKEKPLPEITKDDILPKIPSSWLHIRLGEIGDWGAGATPSRSRSDFYGGQINWFKSGELNNGVMDYNSKETINELAIKNASLRLNKVGDVLIAMYGATIGKTGLLAVDGTTNQAICACTPFSCISNVYLHLLLKALKEVFINQGEGGAQPNISRIKLRNQIFALPPLEEQKAIVNIVNQLFKEVEELEQQTKARIQLKEDFVTSALQQLATGDAATEWTFLQGHFKTFFTGKTAVKKLRESILQLAVQGKLTRVWREGHPELVSGAHSASALLLNIKAEKAQLVKDKKIKKEKPLPEIGEDEIPYELPNGWEWCRFQDCATIASNLVPPQGYLELPHIAPDVIEKGNGRLLNYRTIGEDGVSSAKHYFFAGQIVYSKIRPNLNKLVEVDFEGLCSADMYPISPYIFRSYLFNYMLSRTFLKQSVKTDTRVAMPKINQAELSIILVPIAPLEEQNAIVSQVNSLMAFCDTLEKEIKQNTRHVEQLMKSCLREVFEGEEAVEVRMAAEPGGEYHSYNLKQKN